MAKSVPLTVSKRGAEERPNHLRKAGLVPGVVYGKVENMSVKCDAKQLHKVYLQAGESTLVELDVDSKKIPCLIHSLSFEPVTGAYEHIDFYAVDMTKKVSAKVPVRFEGESPAVKTLAGVLVTVHDHVTVTSLPADLPSHFTINLATLENFRDTVMVSALQVPQNVTITDAPETVLVTVQEPRAEEVIEPVVTVTPEGEAAAGAEGAPAAGAGAAPGDAKAAAPAAGAKGAPKAEEKKK